MVRGMNGQAGADGYPGRMRGSGGPLLDACVHGGNIEQLASGSLRVYAGVDVLTGRDLYLKQTIKAGPDAMVLAQRNLQEFNRLVQEGRQPKTNASLRLLVERHLEVADIERRARRA
jgi:hypothetical protein